jgi:hypothetical protein
MHIDEINNSEARKEQRQIESVWRNPYIVRRFKQPIALSVQLAAVKIDASTIMFINNPPVEVLLQAMKNFRSAIKYIKNPSDELQMAAVKIYPNVVSVIPHPSINVINACKHIIIKSILIDVAEGNKRSAVNTLNKLKENVDWPELDIIQKSLNAHHQQ